MKPLQTFFCSGLQIFITYTCPSSCAIVYAVLSPLSSAKAQLLDGSHIVPSSAKPDKKQKHIGSGIK